MFVSYQGVCCLRRQYLPEAVGVHKALVVADSLHQGDGRRELLLRLSAESDYKVRRERRVGNDAPEIKLKSVNHTAREHSELRIHL